MTVQHPRLPGSRLAAAAALELAGGVESMGELRTLRALRRLGPDAPQVEIWADGRRRIVLPPLR